VQIIQSFLFLHSEVRWTCSRNDGGKSGSFESERGTRVRRCSHCVGSSSCACVNCGDRVVTQTWGLRVRSTTTSDDVVIVTRLIAIRGVGVSPSLSHRPLVLLSRFLSFAILDTSARHLLSLYSRRSLVRAIFFDPCSDASLVSYFTVSFFFRSGLHKRDRDCSYWCRHATPTSCLSINLLGECQAKNLTGAAAQSDFKLRWSWRIWILSV